MSVFSPLPQLSEYIHFNPTDEHIEDVKKWLRSRHPKHSDTRPLTWYYAYLVLEVSEVTIREYVKKGILKDLTIPSISEFIARRDLVWDRYGRPEDSTDYLDDKIAALKAELNEWRKLNGKISIEEEERIKQENNQLFFIEYEEYEEPTTQKYEKKSINTFNKLYGSTVSKQLSIYDFIDAVMQGDDYADQQD